MTTLHAPAKINLHLRVVGKRPDGYHDLDMILVKVGLCDTLRVKLGGPEEIILHCDDPTVPTDASNTLHKAVTLFQVATGLRFGICLHLEKRIPHGGGLGGGSSDAGALLRHLNDHFGEPLSDAQLTAVATRVGADVPFFLVPGAQRVQGIGERLTPLEALPELHVVLVHPGFPISTASVYQALKLPLTPPGTVANLPLSFQTVSMLLPFVTNDLESVVIPRHPEIAVLKKRLLSLGGDVALMSGSGSTVFGLFTERETAAAAAQRLQAEFPEGFVVVANVRD